ncbi:MAG TPA: haloacid dehalogenase type II [Verrucomicrobiae bacterium]
MILARRKFLELGAGAVAGTLLQPSPSAANTPRSKIRAVAFDAFPLLDPRPVFAKAEELFPGRGTELGIAWRTRQFEYTWLRTMAGHYADFWQVTNDALNFAAKALGLELDSNDRARLMNAYLELRTWPDVPGALTSLKAAGIQLAVLSNFSERMLTANFKNSNLAGSFDYLLSTDKVGKFKPSPRAYQMAEHAFGVDRGRIVFAAFAAWDAAGAKWFGFPTVWVNRLNSAAEELSVIPDATCSDLSGVVAFATSHG